MNEQAEFERALRNFRSRVSEREERHIALRWVKHHVSEQDYKRIERGFDEGYEHVKGKRHNLHKRLPVMLFINQANDYFKKASSKKERDKPLQHGRGLGILMAVIDFGLFRNEWNEHDTKFFKRDLHKCIKHIKHDDKRHHHPELEEYIETLEKERQVLMTPAEKDLGDWLLEHLN